MSQDQALVKNASDKGQVEKAKRRERTDREKELDDLRFVLGCPQGRRVFWRMIGRTGAFNPPVYPAEENNSLRTFKDGERNIGLFLYEEILEAKPQRWIQMQQELGLHKNEEK